MFDCPFQMQIKWGDLRHRYELGDWFITPVYNIYERAINVEFGKADFFDKPFTLHMYTSLVDAKCYYAFGCGIANNDSDIGPLAKLYADVLRTSGSQIF